MLALRGLPAPRRLVLALVVVERLGEAGQHLGRGLEHRLELRLVDLPDVLAQMSDVLLQAGFHLVRVVAGVALVGAHRPLLVLEWGCRASNARVSSSVADTVADVAAWAGRRM